MDRVALIREHVPDVALTTDIIVGFPGETEADFRETLEVVEEVGYDGAFTFIFSPRRGTEAAALEDPVPHEEKVERMQRLVEVVQRRARERAQRFVGRTLEVLVEGTSRTDPSRLRGRTRHNKVVNFAGLAAAGRVRRRRDPRGDEPDADGRAGRACSCPPPEPPLPSVRRYANIRSCAGTGRPSRTDEQARLPGHARHRRGAPVRRARGARHPVLRGPAKSALNRVPAGSRVPFRWTVNPYRGCSPCVRLLLRPPDARVPRVRRRPRLREGDRRQGQRAGGAAEGARAAVLEARARRDGHQHRPVPVGRGPLQADARHLGGAARLREPVLDPHEVAAAAARPRPDAARSRRWRT